MSTYLKPFIETAKECATDFQLIGDCLLVEEIPAAEVKTKGGLYIPTQQVKSVDGFEANRPVWVRVLQTGPGYFEADNDGDVVEKDLDTKPGDIVMVGKLAVKWLSVFGPITSSPEHNLGLVRDTEVQARFSGQEGHDKYFATLQAKLTPAGL